jgi:hypothetical protein
VKVRRRGCGGAKEIWRNPSTLGARKRLEDTLQLQRMLMLVDGASRLQLQSPFSAMASFTAPTPAGAARPENTAKIAMDKHEFDDFLASISRGLMKDKDQITKIKAAASAHSFTCEQAVAVANVTKGHPVEAICALYPSIVDADENFNKVLQGLKWIEERQEVVNNLKLDASKYADVLKK